MSRVRERPLSPDYNPVSSPPRLRNCSVAREGKKAEKVLLFKHPLIQKKKKKRERWELFGRFDQIAATEGTGGRRNALFPELKVKLELENKEAIGQGASNQYLKPY